MDKKNFPNVNSSFLINDDVLLEDALLGNPPHLDSFAGTIAISRIEYPKNLKRFLKKFTIIPAFVFYSGNSYYRAYGCHEVIEPFTKFTSPVLHLAVRKNDFAVHFMSPMYLESSDFYSYYPAVFAFGQYKEDILPPKGGQLFGYGDRYYFQLFHFTTKAGKEAIIADKYLKASKWNFYGTRELTVNYCYFTDISIVKRVYDTLPLLIRKTRQSDTVFLTDDLNTIEKIKLKIDNRQLTEKIPFLVSPNVIKPNPMVIHHEIKGQPKWLEIMFPHIYRCPCNGVNLVNKIEINGEDHWIIDSNLCTDFRINDPICLADGNNIESLLKLIDDCFIESQEQS